MVQVLDAGHMESTQIQYWAFSRSAERLSRTAEGRILPALEAHFFKKAPLFSVKEKKIFANHHFDLLSWSITLGPLISRSNPPPVNTTPIWKDAVDPGRFIFLEKWYGAACFGLEGLSAYLM